MARAPALPTWEHSSLAWLPPALVAVAWLGGLWSVAPDDVANRRALAFVGGPTLLLAGIHDRLAGYLHSPDRSRLVSLPVPGGRHFAAALGRHVRRMLPTAILGTAATVLAFPAAAFGQALHVELVLQWGWLLLMALPCEVAAAGASAYLGRRFSANASAYRLQELLTGGWTNREAAVHLYAPAVAVAGAVLLAMPGHLTVSRWTDGSSLSSSYVTASLLPLAAVLPLLVLARLHYARHVWPAVAWLHETIKTIAGPPQPEHAPAWLLRVRHPVTRLLLLRTLRLTPFAQLRFLAVVGLGSYLAVRPDAPTLVSLIVFMLALFGWVLPLRRARSSHDDLERLLAALPLRQRRGIDIRFYLWTMGLPLLLCATVSARWSLS